MKQEHLRLPKQWPRQVRQAVVQAFSLAFCAVTHSRGWAINSPLERVRLKSDLERAVNEISLLRDEIRIKDARMNRVPAPRRPHYSPTERLSILELRAARGWSAAQTARGFLVEAETVSAWTRRVNERGEQNLVRLPGPINKFPDFVSYLVQRFKVLCPTLGKKRIAHILARAGLQLGTTTVGRILASPPIPPPSPEPSESEELIMSRTVTAKYPDHVWHIDLTAVPTRPGFWLPTLPFSLPQLWPFCWWVALVLDHYSRRVVAFRVFHKPPSAQEICRMLQDAIDTLGHAPKYIVSDKGTQFWCQEFKDWCRNAAISPRFGAVGRYGSIAIIERFNKSLKNECLRAFLIPLRRRDLHREIELYLTWYHRHRPHQALGGTVPFERDHPAAVPPAITNIRTPEIARRNLPLISMQISFLEGRRHLPIVELRKAA